MQTTSTALTRAITEGHQFKVVPYVAAEWEINRYNETVTVTNDGGHFDEVIFPIESIVGRNRPYGGMAKAFVGQSRVADNESTIRYRVVPEEQPESGYTYWISPTPSAANAVGGVYPITNVQPTVVYDKAYRVNKIIVKFEEAWTRPVDFTVSVLLNGVWTQVAANPPVDSKGQVILYLQGDGTWQNIYSISTGVLSSGVRINVTSMNKASVPASVIELGLRYEQNLTEDFQSVTLNKARESVEVGYPAGTATANTADFVFVNTDGRYNPDNLNSDLYGYLDVNAKLVLSYGVDTSAYGGSGIEYVAQGTFFADNWASDGEGVVTASCTDFSKFLQEAKTPPCFFQDQPVSLIIRDILEMAGFNRHIYNIGTEVEETILPYVFYNDQPMVWDSIAQVARADQGSFEYNELRYFVYTNRQYVIENHTPAYTIQSLQRGTTLPNLISGNTLFEAEANQATIRYQTLAPKQHGKLHENAILWNPEDEIVLQAANIRRDMDSTQTYFWIGSNEAKFWPPTGLVNIEGEIIEYGGMEVMRNGVKKIRRKPKQYLRYKPTGKLVDCKRGAWGTLPNGHFVNINGWSATVWGSRGSAVPNGMMYQGSGGYMILDLPNRYDLNNYGMALRGNSNTKFDVYGTKVRFTGSKNEVAGLCWNMDSNGKAGYYVQLMTTKEVGRQNNTTGEIKVYRRFSDGSGKGLPNNDVLDPKRPNKVGGKYGFDFEIVEGRDYQIDVEDDPGRNEIRVYVDGIRVTTFSDPYGSVPTSGRWGMFVRGATRAKFEYAYGVNYKRRRWNVQADAFIDRLNGSYVSGFPMKERYKSNKIEYIFDEFAPVAHEIREFNVTFNEDVVPALSAYPFVHLDWLVNVPKFVYTPFGAKFYVANTRREQVIVKGEDKTLIPGETLENDIAIYGVPVIRSDEKIEKVRDRAAIRRRGLSEIEIANPWIQTREQAEELGQYIINTWGEPREVMEVECIGHPGLQTGDIVALDWPEMNMSPADYLFHVVEISMDYDQGITTRLTLRRARF